MNCFKKILLITSLVTFANTSSLSLPAFSILSESLKKATMSNLHDAGKILAFALATSGIVNGLLNITTAYRCPEQFAHCAYKHAKDNETIYRATYENTKASPLKAGIMTSLRTTPLGMMITSPLALVAFYGKKSCSLADLSKLSILSLPILGVAALASGIYYYRAHLPKNLIEQYEHIRQYANNSSAITAEKEIGNEEQDSAHTQSHLLTQQNRINGLQRIRLTHTFENIHRTIFCVGSCIALGAATALHAKNIYDALA